MDEITTAYGLIGELEHFVRRFVELHDRLPITLDELRTTRPQLMLTVPADPWGQSFVYRTLGVKSFELFSIGADGLAGTADDLR